MCSEDLPWLARISQSHLGVTPSRALRQGIVRAAISKPSLACTLGSTHSDPQRASNWRKTLSVALFSLISQTQKQAVGFIVRTAYIASEALNLSQATFRPYVSQRA